MQAPFCIASALNFLLAHVYIVTNGIVYALNSQLDHVRFQKDTSNENLSVMKGGS